MEKAIIKRRFLEAMSMLDRLYQLDDHEKQSLRSIFDEIWSDIIGELAEEYGFDFDKAEYGGIGPDSLTGYGDWEKCLHWCEDCDENGPFIDSQLADQVRDHFISDLQNLRRVIQNQALVLENKIDVLATNLKNKGDQDPSGTAKNRDRVGRPKVLQEEAEKRRSLKTDWEKYRDTIKGSNKKENFCIDKGIKVDYLNNKVLRWCRDNPK